MSVAETTGQAGSSGHTNPKTEVGVPRTADASQISIARVLDIGVPTNYALTDIHPAMPNMNTQDRSETNANPAAQDLMGIGVPYNPNTGVTSE